MKNKKQRRVMSLLILILGITIGFALLSTTLYINGTAGIKGNTWDIHWDDTSINVDNGSVSANTPLVSTKTTSKDTVSFNVELELPGDYFEFEIDAINEGSVDAELELEQQWITYKIDNTEANLPSYLDFKVTYDDDTTPTSGDVLRGNNGTQTYKIRVEFKSSVEELPPDPKPVDIEVRLPYVQHKDRGIKYDLGDLVYFDPASENTCDSSTFDLNGIKSYSSTCYKWRVITTNDTEEKTIIKLQLDHNLSYSSTWGSGPTSKGPTCLSSLYRPSWSRIPLLNYTYDVTNVANVYGNGYGVLNCVEGACTVSSNSNTSFAPGLKARLITLEELAEIFKVYDSSVNWDSASLTTEYYFYGNNTPIGNNLSWLMENTYNDEYASTSDYGYWTLSPTSFGSSLAWYVKGDGYLEYYNTNQSSHYGLRPVIEIEKSKITKN